MELSLGKKIKMMRKELKMTQSALAGNEMTKSMLSQIENDNASPSMKNLQYLANKLGKPVSYFLDNETYQEDLTVTSVDLPIIKINEEIKKIDSLIEEKRKSIAIDKLKGLLSQYSFDKNSKIYADILQKIGKCLIDLNHFAEGNDKIRAVVKIYKSLNLYKDAAKAHLSLADVEYAKYDYWAALKIVREAEQIYNNSIPKDTTFEIEILHLLAMLLVPLGEINEGLTYLDKAIEVSNETNTYYKTDEMYRLKATVYLFEDKYEDFKYNIEKAEQFAKFTENQKSLGSIELTKAISDSIHNRPDSELEHLKNSESLLGEKFYVHYIQEADAYYKLGQYNKALESISSVKMPEFTLHKLDYLLYWYHKVYEGLILNKLGKPQEAIAAIKEGIRQLEEQSISKYLARAYKSLSEVYSEIKDYENAFKALKKSEEIFEEAKRKGVIW